MSYDKQSVWQKSEIFTLFFSYFILQYFYVNYCYIKRLTLKLIIIITKLY